MAGVLWQRGANERKHVVLVKSRILYLQGFQSPGHMLPFLASGVDRVARFLVAGVHPPGISHVKEPFP
eukprot:scaffold4384_cov367-Prasinococcus_capsulatus_cf.AAC.11